MSSIRYVFLGTPEIAVACVDALTQAGFPPTLVITAPNRPAGRGQVLTPPPVKIWADAHHIPTLQPEKLDAVLDEINVQQWDVFVLAAYGQILSKKFLNIPRLGVVNMHPSLLPKLRGPSPIRTALLTNVREHVGVSIMIIDHKMDHGPVVAQKPITLETWPLMGSQLDTLLANEGARLLAEVLPAYVGGTITPHEQNHEEATYCKMIEKKDAEINLADDAKINLQKICAYDGWPSAYTIFDKNGKKIRLKIISAHIEAGTLILDRVVPEGKNEMYFSDFARN